MMLGTDYSLATKGPQSPRLVPTNTPAPGRSAASPGFSVDYHALAEGLMGTQQGWKGLLTRIRAHQSDLTQRLANFSE